MKLVQEVENCLDTFSAEIFQKLSDNEKYENAIIFNNLEYLCSALENYNRFKILQMLKNIHDNQTTDPLFELLCIFAKNCVIAEYVLDEEKIPIRIFAKWYFFCLI